VAADIDGLPEQLVSVWEQELKHPLPEIKDIRRVVILRHGRLSHRRGPAGRVRGDGLRPSRLRPTGVRRGAGNASGLLVPFRQHR